jgi:hypothetical protein
MKTRYKIIIVGIVLTTIIFGTHQYLMYQCGTLPIFMQTPRSPNLWNCLEIWENQSEQHPNVPPPINPTLESQSLMQKAQSLGIDNVMEAVDSEELSFDEKREYIKIRYEESPKNIPSLNIRIKDFTRNLEFGERPTFTVIETGYAIPCTHPKLEVYLLKQEIGNEYTPDDLIYEDQIMYSCPYFDSFSPVLRFWDETDFEPFPACEKEGRYLVIGDSGYERMPLEQYYCNAPHEDYSLSYDENAQYLVEQLFMDALEETHEGNLQLNTFIVIKSQNNEPQHDNYCGFAHLESEEVWFDADFAENRIVKASFVDPPSPYCEDDDHSCFCDLQEELTGERESYEEFFREHVSETCPIILMPKDGDGLSFDPTKCEWIEIEN